ncbi:arylsulfatase A family protein [Halogeometricum borinquense DSM 11551]|nr:arylsulfatase A family protein [Halogeometricum borinquense DSM 11551]
MDAHKPFIPERAIDGPKVTVTKEKLGYLNDYEREDDPPSKEHQDLLWELYEANVRYLDRGLGRALLELQSQDWYDDALIILASDHGELFGEHGYMWHPMTIDPVEELIDVPLAVKFPSENHAGDIVQHRVQHADIPATVASVLDQQSHPRDDTHPLLDSSSRLTVSKSNTSIRVTGPDGYVIKRRDGTEDEYGTVTNELREKVRSEPFPSVKTMSGDVRGIDDVQRMEQLEALGYR